MVFGMMANQVQTWNSMAIRIIACRTSDHRLARNASQPSYAFSPVARQTNANQASIAWQVETLVSTDPTTGVSTTTVLTEVKLLDQIQACYEAGGRVDRRSRDC